MHPITLLALHDEVCKVGFRPADKCHSVQSWLSRHRGDRPVRARPPGAVETARAAALSVRARRRARCPGGVGSPLGRARPPALLPHGRLPPEKREARRPRFWTVRATVGVIGNVVVTVRLPDLWWNDEGECLPDYTPGGPLDVAQRFFPNTDDLTADDVAEAIGLQQASTARAVSKSIRTRLTNIERASRHEVSGVARRDRKAKHENAHSVIDMTDTLYQLDRQLERPLAPRRAQRLRRGRPVQLNRYRGSLPLRPRRAAIAGGQRPSGLGSETDRRATRARALRVRRRDRRDR